MTAADLRDNVKFASEVNEDRTLDEAIQRTLNESRVKRDIVTYVRRQPDRFFSSIVVAALKGNPRFIPVRVSDEPAFELFAGDEQLNDSFGVLVFDGTQEYYALDGQHRLAALKAALDRNAETSNAIPEDLGRDEISVIVVVPGSEEQSEFMKKYRRLFSNLNRYAKPTDQATNIIMDEDDVFAILTRRLISFHPFFEWSGRQRESARIKTEKGKNLNSSDPYFTSLETLYEMNVVLLSSRERQNNGWDPEGIGTSEFKRFRPDEEYIDKLHEELFAYWDGLLEAVPELKAEHPNRMRTHYPRDDEEATHDSLVFWPIGQELLAHVARRLLDTYFTNVSQPVTKESVAEALAPLGGVDWELHHAPWRYFLLIDGGSDPCRPKWKMRNEDRNASLRVAQRILLWLVGHDELDQSEVDELRIEWRTRLIPAQTDEVEAAMWDEVKKRRAEILAEGGCLPQPAH